MTGHVLLDARGLPVDFRTTDRFYDSPDGPIRREWRTPVASWDRTGPQPFPGPARATWLLPEPFPYAEGQFLADTFRRDVVPRDA